MKLWIVTHGERGEGQSPVSLHLKPETAMVAALARARRWRKTPPEPTDFKQVGMQQRWEYEDGGDITAFEEIEVQP